MQLSLAVVLNYTREHKFTWSILSVMYEGTTSWILSKFLLALLWWALLTYYFADNTTLRIHELFLEYYKTPRITWSFIISIPDVCTEKCSSNMLETKLIVRNNFFLISCFHGFPRICRHETQRAHTVYLLKTELKINQPLRAQPLNFQLASSSNLWKYLWSIRQWNAEPHQEQM